MSNIILTEPFHTLLIPSLTDDHFALLVKDTDDGVVLPEFQAPQVDFGTVGYINEIVEQQFGLRVSTMRCLSDDYEPTRDSIVRYYALDNLMPDWTPTTPFRWLKVNDLSQATLCYEADQQAVSKWFRWVANDDLFRVPWWRIGWYQELELTLQDLAERLDLEAISNPTQDRVWARSCTLHLDTGKTNLYLKAVPPVVAYEPVITRVLSLRFEKNLPRVLAVNVDEAWMLIEKVGGHLLNQVQDLDVWANALRTYARIQIELISSTRSLISLGVPDRNIDHLSSQIDRLMIDLPDSLLEAEKEQLYRLTRGLRNWCYDLIDFKIPLSVVHGDFSHENIIITQENDVVILDWSDCAIAHPFFDIPLFLANLDAYFPHDEGAKDFLRDVYLQEWIQYAPLHELQRAYALAEILSPLHHVMMITQFILPTIEQSAQWELNRVIPHLLRQVTASAKAYSPY